MNIEKTPIIIGAVKFISLNIAVTCGGAAARRTLERKAARSADTQRRTRMRRINLEMKKSIISASNVFVAKPLATKLKTVLKIQT